MKGINKVILVGTITSEINSRPLNSTISVSFNLATNRNYHDHNNERQEITEYSRIVINGQRAEYAVKKLHKGQKLYLEGFMQTRRWTDEQGIERPITEVICDKVEFLFAADHVYQQGIDDQDYQDEGPEPYNQEKYNQNRPTVWDQPQRRYQQNNQARYGQQQAPDHRQQNRTNNGFNQNPQQKKNYPQNRSNNGGFNQNQQKSFGNQYGSHQNRQKSYGNKGGSNQNQSYNRGHNQEWPNNGNQNQPHNRGHNQGWANNGNQNSQYRQGNRQHDEDQEQNYNTHFSHSYNK